MKQIPYSRSRTDFIQKALPFLEERYEQVVYLNPNDYHNYPGKPFRHLLAFGSTHTATVLNDRKVFDTWKHMYALYPAEWLFIYLSYEAKNSTEHFVSTKKEISGFDKAVFFVPEYVLELTETGTIVLKGNVAAILSDIEKTEIQSTATSSVQVSALMDKQSYIEHCRHLQQELEKGNIYEINFCIPFSGQGSIQPSGTYAALNTLSAMPFSAYVKNHSQYILCASPERFIKKEQQTLISQPIKGTARRGITEADDLLLKEQLRRSEKERSENSMIVDLVRNDLSRTASNGSVQVPELHGIYTFPNVHQMISTVQSRLDDSYTVIDAVQQAFPMGSMTGAPKIRAMQIIDEKEPVSRGPFSGSVGYMDPDNNMDLNVLIRSIFYNSQTEQIFWEAGSAITWYADAEKEYEECMLKVAPLLKSVQ